MCFLFHAWITPSKSSNNIKKEDPFTWTNIKMERRRKVSKCSSKRGKKNNVFPSVGSTKYETLWNCLTCLWQLVNRKKWIFIIKTTHFTKIVAHLNTCKHTCSLIYSHLCIALSLAHFHYTFRTTNLSSTSLLCNCTKYCSLSCVT